MENEVRLGVYKHFKGGLYEVVGVARDVESSLEYVLYVPLYGERKLVLRLKSSFTQELEGEFGRIRRFAFVRGPADVESPAAPTTLQPSGVLLSTQTC